MQPVLNSQPSLVQYPHTVPCNDEYCRIGDLLPPIRVDPSGAPIGYFLVGDIGGTNTRLDLVLPSNGMVLHRLRRKTADFKNLSSLLKTFFSEISSKQSTLQSRSLEEDITEQEKILKDSKDMSEKNITASICMASKIIGNTAVTAANFSWELPKGNLVKTEFGRQGK